MPRLIDYVVKAREGLIFGFDLRVPSLCSSVVHPIIQISERLEKE